MKVAILLAVLAVVATHAAVIPDVNEEFKDEAVMERSASRQNLNVGWVQPGDRLLYRTYLRRNPINNAVQYQDFNYRGAARTVINHIRAIEVGHTQFAAAWIRSGGLGRNNVSLRVQSARGRGYYYMIEVWGRY